MTCDKKSFSCIPNKRARLRTLEKVLIIPSIATLDGETPWSLLGRDDRQRRRKACDLDDRSTTVVRSYCNVVSIRPEQGLRQHTGDSQLEISRAKQGRRDILKIKTGKLRQLSLDLLEHLEHTNQIPGIQ